MARKIYMKDFEIRASFCPYCFRLLDAASNVEGEGAPQPGDFTLCIECSSVLRFDEEMNLVMSSWDDIPLILRASFAQLKMAIEEVKKKHEDGGKVWCK